MPPAPIPDPAAPLRHSLALQGQAVEVARGILAVFDAHQGQFLLVTRRAEARFRQRDWRGGQQDAAERLTLYRQFVSWCVADLRRGLGEAAGDTAQWRGIREAYAREARPRLDAELAYTFFNSVVRQVLRAVGPGKGVYFDDADFQALLVHAAGPVFRTYHGRRSLEELLRALLADLPFAEAYARRDEDARLLAARLAEELARLPLGGALEALEMVPTPFYRNKGAYLVGRIRAGTTLLPLVLPLVHDEDGIRMDAVLPTSDEVSVVFSFTRSYFHVALDCPRAMVEFLRTLMPRKPLDELYTSLGYHKHGKTELVRALLRHMEHHDAHFEVAAGDKGLVMAVFALPSLNVVFKLIKDRFGPPKHTTRAQVMEKYQLVFVRDRVGRLADAQDFEGLTFRRDTFAPGLLEELLAECGSTIQVEGDQVVFRHLYTERRVTPLNLYLRQADEAHAIDAVLDYGQAIKDLAAANIFTGDMLLKNFGVTRHGRVIFYDYDELCLLTECNFRAIPAARHDDDEYSAEPWFSVGEHDIFPEEFRAFLTLPGRPGEAFLRAHGDLLTVAYWRHMQQLAERGEVVDIFPYPPGRRLRAG
ncbi:MAG: bifunctional isocitrate dehydrogenase kinase/phosphatase [Gemmatimonadetes bacterium]|nr:bifunctional isocitrate dehydrogenase kinase/phosphatase [Gemmatimonadota bacterium]